MRVLWLCNVMLPIVGEHLNRSFSNGGGWLDGLSQDILRDEKFNLELAVCFPISFQEKMICGEVEKNDNNKSLKYYGFPIYTTNEAIYDKRTEIYLKKITEEYKPDIIHIFGTEFAHTLAMTRIFPKKEKIIISMQGIMSVYSKCYEANLPKKIVQRYTFRDYMKHDNIQDGKNRFLKRAEYEQESLNKVIHVVGRTKFDFEETFKINASRKYYKLNETLRSIFYENNWKLENVEKHSIFCSQGNYPIKGLHFMLMALSELKKEYPDIKLYVAGDKSVPNDTLKSNLKRSSYGKYLQSLIKKNRLQNSVVFTGSLSSKKMCERYQKSHVFVSASVIENSPNSVGEAMLLGMPVISSKVGGVVDMIQNQKEGILVEPAKTNEIVAAVIKIFSNDQYANTLGDNARARAMITHNRKQNYTDLIEIYNKIGKETHE